MSRKTRYFYLALCIVCICLLQGGIIICNRGFISENIVPGIPNNSICGIITMMQTIVAIIMIIIDWEKGGFIAECILGGLCLWSAFVTFALRSYVTAPGVVSLSTGFIVNVLLRYQFKIRQDEANHDYLTKLPNRRFFIKELQERLNKGNPFYLIYIDLNNFKRINDAYGHAYGDLFLTETVKYWKERLRPEDFLSRIAGDEFVMLIPKKDISSIESFIVPMTVDLAYKKVQGFDNNIYSLLGASAGIVSFPDDGVTDEELLRKADFAMYKAKKETHESYCFYDADIEKQIVFATKMEELIQKGFEEDKFFLMYQPQFEASTRALRGFEALIRLKDDNGDIIGPSSFIPLMEKIGNIAKIDLFVLNKAMQDYGSVVKSNPSIKISVNISAPHITDPSFIDAVESTLRANDFNPDNLEIEITEYSLIHSMDNAVKAITRLHDMGVSIALDDFGTGYSSLSMLAKLPLDLIKIDKGLVENIHIDKDSRDLVGHIITIGQSLNCEILSEGIENEEQAEILKEQGCNYIQGFLWGKPHTHEESMKAAM